MGGDEGDGSLFEKSSAKTFGRRGLGALRGVSWYDSVSFGGFFLDGVQFLLFDSFLREQLRTVLQGAQTYDAYQCIRKSLWGGQAPPRPCPPQPWSDRWILLAKGILFRAHARRGVWVNFMFRFDWNFSQICGIMTDTHEITEETYESEGTE